MPVDPESPRLQQIRDGLVDVLSQVDGINVVEPYPPNSIGVNGTGWIGFIHDEPKMANREQHVYTVPFSIVVNRNATIAEGTAATEPVIDSAIQVIRDNQTLGIDSVYHVKYTSIDQGIWEVGDLPYVGCQIMLEITQSFPASFR